MAEPPRRDGLAILLGLVLLIGLAAALNLSIDIGRPFGGFIVNQAHSVWVVNASTPSWWPVIATGQLHYDDVLVAIDGQPYTTDSYKVFERDQSAGTAHLLLLRNSQLVTLEVPIQPFTYGNYLDIKLPDALLGLGFWLLGVAVYQIRPAERVNRIFALTMSFVACSIWLALPTIFFESTLLDQILDLAWAASGTFTGVLILHLATVFPAPTRVKSRPIFIALYCGMGLAGLGYIIGWLLKWMGETRLGDPLNTITNDIILYSVGVAALLLVGRLFYLIFVREVSRRIRRQAVFLLIGIGLAVPYLLVIILRSPSDPSGSYFWNNLDFRYLALAAPLTFAYAILRYQTFQTEHQIIMGTFLLASSALLASVGDWLLRLLQPPWANSLSWSAFAPLFVAALVSGTFWSLQSSWRGTLRRLFNWDVRSYRAARLFGQDLATQVDIAQALIGRMELERAALWIWEESGGEFRLAGHAGAWPALPPVTLRPAEPPALRRSLRLDTSDAVLSLWLQPLGGGLLEVVTPLVVSDQIVGLLGLGKRWDEEIFDQRDVEIVELIAQQAAMFLIIARHIEELRQVPGLIAAAQEEQQFRIAQELHDTVQQFLGRLPFYLETSRAKAQRDPAEADAILIKCMAEARVAARAVRQIRQNLAPLQLETSFVQPLTALVEQFQDRTGIQSELQLAAGLDTALPPPSRHALYRVIQQTLDNVAAHARANNVSVSMAISGDRLEFAVRDDGVGSTAEVRAEARARGSFGLTSMQARITSLAGEFGIESQPAQGTVVFGWLPLQP